MLSSDNRKNVTPVDPSDLTIGDLMAALTDCKDKPLVFRYGGRAVKPGYHVTEVKAGQFAALDCEANPESWSEIFVQLWDVDEGGPVHMPAGKFAAIIGPLLMGFTAVLTGSSRSAILAVIALFAAGGILLLFVDEEKGAAAAHELER